MSIERRGIRGRAMRLSIGACHNFCSCGRLIVFHPVDVHVGARLRLRRNFVGLSQARLGETVGLTFQQIQKYESGRSRISSSRLYELTKVFDVPVTYFFDEMPPNELSGRKRLGEAGTAFEQEKDPLKKRETLKLVRAYHSIDKRRVRRSIFAAIKVLGEDSHAKHLAGHRKTRAGASASDRRR
jgi:transcriptional regulator with XRE-family HTH domain